MAQFYGTVSGGRGTASRVGTKKSGLSMQARTWGGHVEVRLYHDIRTSKDMAMVGLSTGDGGWYQLYDGPLAAFRDPRGTRIAIITEKEIEHDE